MVNDMALAQDLAQRTLETLIERLHGLEDTPKDNARIRNVQKIAEALIETLEPDHYQPADVFDAAMNEEEEP